jgi:serine/threonine protein kinase
VALYALRSEDPKTIGDARWNVIARLSENPNKSIFLATKDSQRVAIKILSSQLGGSSDDWEKWGQEVAILQELDHPRIPKLVEYDFSDTNMPWIATEYIDGQTIEEFVEKGNLFLGMDWLNLVNELASILNTVHSKGIVHRDISPGNILVRDGQPFLIDFGLAQFLESDSNFVNEMGATKPTISPEHLAENIDPRMDIFSLGSTLVYGGTARFPFEISQEDLSLHATNQDKSSDWENRVLYSRPNLTGLTYSQAKLVRPMLYKRPKDRISSNDLLRSLNGFNLKGRMEPKIDYSILRSYLRYGDRKLKGRSSLYGKKRRIRQLTGLTLSLILMSIGILTGTINDALQAFKDRQISDCVRFIELGSFDEAIRSCLADYEKGTEAAAPYLALAYLAKDLKLEASKVLDDCRQESEICNSLFYLNSTDTATARRVWSEAFTNGFTPAAYFLSRSFSKDGEETLSINWIKRGHEAGSALSTLFYSVALSSSGQEGKALEIAKSIELKPRDVIWQPELLKIPNYQEKWISSLYIRNRDSEGAENYFLKCANEGVPYCMGELALIYERLQLWEKASVWADKGARSGDGAAMYVLANYYRNLNGTYALNKEKYEFTEQIAEWRMKSAESGYIPAMKDAWGQYLFFRIFSKKSDNSDDIDVEKACYWYMKTLVAIEDEKERGFANYFNDGELEYDKESRRLMDWMNCTTRF